MAVGGRPSMSGQVLDHRQHATGHQTRYYRPAQFCDNLGIAAKCTITDNIVGADFRHIQNRQTIDVDPQKPQVFGDQPGIHAGRFTRLRTIIQSHAGKKTLRRMLDPVGGPQPLYPTPFLIEQDRGVVTTDRITQITDQCADLTRCFAISGKKDEAERIGFSKEKPLSGTERGSGTAENGCR